MDLVELSDGLGKAFEQSYDFKQLYQVFAAYKYDEATKEACKKNKECPPLVARIAKGEPLKEVLSSIQMEAPAIEAYNVLFRWLNLVLYSTCHILPHLNEQNAHNVSLGSPFALWLHKEYRAIEICCSVGMILSKMVGAKEVPVALIRLPELTERFKKFILPKMTELHQQSLDELNEIAKEYMDLFQ